MTTDSLRPEMPEMGSTLVARQRFALLASLAILIAFSEWLFWLGSTFERTPWWVAVVFPVFAVGAAAKCFHTRARLTENERKDLDVFQPGLPRFRDRGSDLCDVRCIPRRRPTGPLCHVHELRRVSHPFHHRNLALPDPHSVDGRYLRLGSGAWASFSLQPCSSTCSCMQSIFAKRLRSLAPASPWLTALSTCLQFSLG